MNVCSAHMSKEQDTKPQILTFVRRVMPDTSSADLAEATAVFAQYLNVVLRMYRRMKQQLDPESDSREDKTYARVASDK